MQIHGSAHRCRIKRNLNSIISIRERALYFHLYLVHDILYIYFINVLLAKKGEIALINTHEVSERVTYSAIYLVIMFILFLVINNLHM